MKARFAENDLSCMKMTASSTLRIEYKRKASLVVGNMCGLVTDGKALVRYAPALVPDLVACVRDSNPEMRSYGASALAALLKGMASAHLAKKFDDMNAELEK